MKQKIAFLAGLMMVANTAAVSGCANQNWSTKLIDLQPASPTTYNLTEQLQVLNELEFVDQMPEAKLDDYAFNNTWFNYFVPSLTNGGLANFFGHQTATKIIPFRENASENIPLTFNNGTNNLITFNTIGGEYDFIGAKYNHLLSDLPVNIPFNFSISGNYFMYPNQLDLKNQTWTDLSINHTILPSQSINVSPYSLAVFSQKQALELSRIEGVLTFALHPKTEIVFQIENKSTHEKRDLFYTIADLEKKSQTQQKYRDFLTDPTHFFYQLKQNSTFEMRFKAVFELVTKEFLTIVHQECSWKY